MMKNGRNISVLIIDDNEMMRAVLRVILQSEGYDVIGEASNGKNGLELAQKLRPDIICLDIVMPDSDGLEILREIRGILPATVVLMVTVNNDRETVQTAIRRGASGFIIKPFNSGTVIDTVNKAAALVGVPREALADRMADMDNAAEIKAEVEAVIDPSPDTPLKKEGN